MILFNSCGVISELSAILSLDFSSLIASIINLAVIFLLFSLKSINKPLSFQLHHLLTSFKSVFIFLQASVFVLPSLLSFQIPVHQYTGYIDVKVQTEFILILFKQALLFACGIPSVIVVFRYA